MRGIDVTGAVCDFTVFIAMGSHHLCTNQRSLWTPKCVCVYCDVCTSFLPAFQSYKTHTFTIFHFSFFIFFSPVQTGIVFNVERCGFEPIFIHAQPTNLKGIHLFVHYCSVARRAQNWFDYTFFYISRHFLTLALAASTYSEHEWMVSQAHFSI